VRSVLSLNVDHVSLLNAPSPPAHSYELNVSHAVCAQMWASTLHTAEQYGDQSAVDAVRLGSQAIIRCAPSHDNPRVRELRK
jgi:hypothetical protein